MLELWKNLLNSRFFFGGIRELERKWNLGSTISHALPLVRFFDARILSAQIGA